MMKSHCTTYYRSVNRCVRGSFLK